MTEPRSRFEKLLREGNFVVTGELETTDSPRPESIKEMTDVLVGKVDALNVTDNSAAHPHISNVAASKLLIDLGFEPITQFVCRDRNRLALQADLLGAMAMGVQNVCALTGDDVSAGDHPEAKPIYDLDSMHLLRIFRIMRDEGTYLSGRKLTEAPSFFLGCVENPFAPPQDYRPIRLKKKVEAGAEFCQLQLVFNMKRMREFMHQVGDLGILDDVFIMPSVCIPRSARALRYMAELVPGIDVPQELLDRMDATPKDRQAEEGLKIGLELVQELKEMQGVSGVHLISIKAPQVIAQVAEDAGFLPRPQVDFTPPVPLAAVAAE